MKELNRFRQFLTEGHINENLDPKTTDFLNRTIDGFLSGDYSDPLKVGEDKTYTFNAIENEAELKVGPDFAKIGDKFVTFEDDEFSTFSAKKLDGDEYAIKVLAKKELNENEVLDGYDKASRKLFDMTWDEVQRENDPRMKQDVHDEVQKDDDLDYIDDVQEADYGQEAYFEKLFKDFEETKKALIDVARVQLASAAYGYNFDASQVGGFAKETNKVKKYLRADFRDVKSNMDSYIKKNYLEDKYWEGDPNKLFGYLRDNMDYTIDNLKQEVKFIINRNGEGLNDPKQKEKYKFELLAIETIKKTVSVLEKFKLTIAKDPRSINERKDFAPEFYEVTYTTLDGNLVERDFKHFTDKGEAIAFHNSLKDNDEIALAIIDKVYYDPKSFLSGRSQQAYYSNPIHQSFLNSRLDDKRFQGSESFNQFLDRKLKGRQEVGTSLALNEDKAQKRFDRLSKDDQTKLMELKAMMNRERDMEESNLKGIREEDDEKGIREETSIEENMPKAIIMRQIRDAEEILDSGEADGVPLDNETEMLVRQELKRLKQMVGTKGMREETSLEEIYKDIMEVDEEEEKIRKEYDSMKRPSQDEVHDAFEKFNRETHYLNDKPVGEWDAYDMSNWKVILRKGGKIN